MFWSGMAGMAWLVAVGCCMAGEVEAVGVASGEAVTDTPGGKRRWWQRR